MGPGYQGEVNKNTERGKHVILHHLLESRDIAIQAAWSAHLVKSLWQYGIDQWIAQNEYIYGKTKEEQVEKKTQEINKQIKAMHRADKFRVRGMDRHLFAQTGTYSLCLLKDSWSSHWTGKIGRAHV